MYVFVTIWKNRSEYILNVNGLSLFWTLEAWNGCACNCGLWQDSQKPCLCWAAPSCHWHSVVCHFSWGRGLCSVALLPGGEIFSKQIRVWGSFYLVLLPHFFPRCQASLECFSPLHQPLVNLSDVSFHLGTRFLQNLAVCWLLMNW